MRDRVSKVCCVAGNIGVIGRCGQTHTLGFEVGALVGASVGGDGMLAAFWTSFRLEPVELAPRRIFPLV